MRQVFSNRALGTFTNTGAVSVFVAGPIFPQPHELNSEAVAQVIMPADGCFENLVVTLSSAPGVGTSWQFIFRVNGADTDLTVTISDTNTTARDTTNTIAVVAGDNISIQAIPTGTPVAFTDYHLSIERVSRVAKETIYGACGGGLQITAGTTYYCGPFGSGRTSTGPWSSVAGATNAIDRNKDIVSLAGTVTRYDILCDVAPGASGSWEFVFLLNGVVQDGTGGTPDTRITATGAATEFSTTFALSIAPADTVVVRAQSTGSPATLRPGISVKVVTLVDGKSMVCSQANAAGSFTWTQEQYAGCWYSHDGLWTTVGGGDKEDDRKINAGVTSFSLDQFYLAVDDGHPQTSLIRNAFTVRKNKASTAITVSINGSVSPSGNDLVNSTTISDGDTWDLRQDPLIGAGASGPEARWSMVQTCSDLALCGAVSPNPIEAGPPPPIPVIAGPHGPIALSAQVGICPTLAGIHGAINLVAQPAPSVLCLTAQAAG